MIIVHKDYDTNDLRYTIRSAIETDAKELSNLRLQIDGETENLDREAGEGFIDEPAFEDLVRADTHSPRNLFLVAVVNNRLIGFSRCEGSYLKRFSHKVEFGICVLKDFWGHGVGRNLLNESITWADANEIKKITLSVLETNTKAIALYKKFGFEIEGVLKNEKMLSNSEYYNTIVMGRLYDKKGKCS